MGEAEGGSDILGYDNDWSGADPNEKDIEFEVVINGNVEERSKVRTPFAFDITMLVYIPWNRVV